MNARSASSLLALTILLSGCAGTDAPTGVSESRLSPSARGLSRNGATVERFESGGRSFFVHWNPDLDYTFTLGLVTPVADLAFCGGSVRPAVVDANWTTQLVRGPKGTIHYLRILEGEATIVLYGQALAGPGSTCRLAALPIVATGTVTTHVQNDNDLRGTAQGANSWGQRLVGTVQLASGEYARLVIVQHYVMRPNDPTDAVIEPVVDRIDLHPIGGQ